MILTIIKIIKIMIICAQDTYEMDRLDCIKAKLKKKLIFLFLTFFLHEYL
jgi:hypothetical protein